MNACASRRPPTVKKFWPLVPSLAHQGAEAHGMHGSAACGTWEPGSQGLPTEALGSHHESWAMPGSTVTWTGHPPRGTRAMPHTLVLVNFTPSEYLERHAGDRYHARRAASSGRQHGDAEACLRGADAPTRSIRTHESSVLVESSTRMRGPSSWHMPRSLPRGRHAGPAIALR
jgi:hypothetical protein